MVKLASGGLNKHFTLNFSTEEEQKQSMMISNDKGTVCRQTDIHTNTEFLFGNFFDNFYSIRTTSWTFYDP